MTKAETVDQLTNVLSKLGKLSGESQAQQPRAFIEQWCEEEALGVWWLSIPGHNDRPAMVYAVFALRALNGGNTVGALNLLQETLRLLQQKSAT